MKPVIHCKICNDTNHRKQRCPIQIDENLLENDFEYFNEFEDEEDDDEESSSESETDSDDSEFTVVFETADDVL